MWKSRMLNLVAILYMELLRVYLDNKSSYHLAKTSILSSDRDETSTEHESASFCLNAHQQYNIRNLCHEVM